MDQYKAMGRRIVALILDGIILSAIYAVIYFPIAEKQEDVVADVLSGESDITTTYFNVGDYTLTGGKAGLFFLAMFVIWFLYYVVLVGTTGRTPGKALTGIRVVRESDETAAPGMGRAFIRQLVWLADSFPYLIPGLTGFIVAMTNPKRKRIGDMAASTVVVQTNQLSHSPAGPAPAAEPPRMGTQAMPAIQVARPEPPPLPTPPSGPPADWYPDPHGEKRLRYWDGTTWTTHTAD